MFTIDARQIGKWGERIALDYFCDKGYTFVCKSFRSRFGEIDLIIKNSKFLVFVEVKTRKNKNFAHAREYVNKVKQRKIIATANYYLMKKPVNLQPRFDVIEIYSQHEDKTQKPEIVHIENAFEVN